MVSHPVNFFIAIQMLELNFWTLIVWMVMHIITCLEYKRLDVVFTKYVQFPIIKMAVMVTIE